MPLQPIIFWFRQDLRLQDNRALQAAHDSGHPVQAVYVLDDESPAQWRHGSASRWWLHHSLQALQGAIEDQGGRLILLRGRAEDCLAQLAAAISATGIYFSRCYEPYAVQQECILHKRLPQLEIKRFAGALLFEPEALRTGAGQPFKVFSPMWKAARKLPEPAAPGNLQSISWSDSSIATTRTESLKRWSLLPSDPDWAVGFAQWQPGEDGAKLALDKFLGSNVVDYKSGRDRPDLRATSELSPHLRFGEISPARIWQASRKALQQMGHLEPGIWSFLRELGWRDFSYHLLFQYPQLTHHPLRAAFENFPWRDDIEKLTLWQRGQTGYPLVDAGMRQLWATGWMHNRVRMIVASFLVKHLLIPWQRGAEWFWDTLVDADLANNSASWQWVAGCGADAAPYFRIFNPIIQGQKFDPNGDYVRRWVPELAQLPNKFIHQPWAAAEQVLQEAGIKLDHNYPAPTVDHAEARQRALAALAQSKSDRVVGDETGRRSAG